MDSSGSDAYEIEAKNGKVYVSGTSATAMCRGAYQYLKDEFDSIATWEGIRLGEPNRVSEEEEREREEQGRIEIEDMPKRRVVCPVRYRHYFNVCTFGYTTAFWDWARWEKEIDWMALHGINMPLAMNAQEAIWQRVWKSYGFTQQQIDGFFAGPAFLPWHRMGNINAHCGPLPQRWHEGQVALQRKILERERALGMKPVVPAFSGFVPPSFSSRFPQAEVLRNAEWAGFEPTFLLSPRDKMFREIGAAFIREYTNEFGTDHLYLADVFNEMTPQVSEKTKLEDLEAAGRAVYDAIAAGDPNGVWVMQGWLFLNDRGFWGAPEVEAFLKPVPNDKMIIIDLACDQYEVWRTQPAVRNKQWIWCVLHNFGGNTAMSGNLKLYMDRAKAALADSNKGNLVGMGITMEGIEQNSINYELATDLMWRTERTSSLDNWVAQWVHNRYGNAAGELQSAWWEIVKQAYSGQYETAAYERRPSFSAAKDTLDDLKVWKRILGLMLAGAQQHAGNELFQHDVCDVAKRFLDEQARVTLYAALASPSVEERKKWSAAYLELLDDIDRLLFTRPEYRLSRWISAARSWGKTDQEKDFMEWNARTQITIWGGPVLHDYAAKEWSGLVSSFYVPRWKMFLDEMITPQMNPVPVETRIAEWEQSWTKQHSAFAVYQRETAAEAAARMLKKYASAPEMIEDRGIAVGKTATDSGGTEEGGSPMNAVDGKATGSYWAAHPYPQWWQVDLGSVERIGSVTVIPFYDGTRYYQYTVEVSTDGTHWKRVADMSSNTTPATLFGVRHSFEPTGARFVRVNMLFNSANVGVHLMEVRVYRS